MMGRALASGIFALYRGTAFLATPLIGPFLRKRLARGREDAQRLGERMGRSGLARPDGPLVWIHGASVGESLSALPLIEGIRARWPQVTVLVTTGTVTSARLMAERLPPGVLHQYVPVDLPGPVERFLMHWRPACGLILESELWPNLLHGARDRGIELALVNGRISERSYAQWKRFRPAIAHLLRLFSIVLAQSREDLRHFHALGAPHAQRVGNLKFAAPPLAADPEELASLRAILGNRPRWLAASTHTGEEEQVAEAHAILKAAHPELLTLIVPRHPDRGAEIAALMQVRGLRVARRSTGAQPDESTDVYIADTLGELGLWYRLAEIVFVGNSLVPGGGHNMLEPAKLDCAILSGPHTANFLRVAQEMRTAGAMREVTQPQDLAAAVGELLGDAKLCQGMREAAAASAESEAGTLDAILQALAPALDRAARSKG